jgi:hypothetical protein
MFHFSQTASESADSVSAQLLHAERGTGAEATALSAVVIFAIYTIAAAGGA